MLTLIAPGGHTALSISTAARAAQFAWAAYDDPPPSLPREAIGDAAVVRFGSGEAGTALPLTPLTCVSMLDSADAPSFDLAGFRRHAFIDVPRTGTQAETWLDEQRRQAVLAFRGTDITSLADIATDIFFTQQQVMCLECALEPGGDPARDGGPFPPRAHSGFVRAYDSVREALRAVLCELGVLDAAGAARADGPALLLTGHSLGGALAILAARELGRALGERLTVYTFGAPRVGDTALALDVLRATRRCAGPYRVVHADDILVPRFPRGTAANRIWDYVHAGATVALPGAAAPRDAAVRVAAVGDGPRCPLREIDPRYRGLFPLEVLRWPSTDLGRFALGELRTLRRVAAQGLAPHFRPAYDQALCRQLAARAEDDGGAADAAGVGVEAGGAGRTPGAPPREDAAWADELRRHDAALDAGGPLTYSRLVRLVWGEQEQDTWWAE